MAPVRPTRKPGPGPPDSTKRSLHDPALRDPRGYIVPADQPISLRTKFRHTLIQTASTVLRAPPISNVAGKRYPANSWIVKSAQAFRPTCSTCSSPGPPETSNTLGTAGPAYDVTGYNAGLKPDWAFRFRPHSRRLRRPYEKVAGLQKPPPEKSWDRRIPRHLISHEVNDSFILVNRLLKNGDRSFGSSVP